MTAAMIERVGPGRLPRAGPAPAPAEPPAAYRSPGARSSRRRSPPLGATEGSGLVSGDSFMRGCYATRVAGGILRSVSHPTLGLPPRSLQSGFPDAATRLRASRAALAVRALEIAVDGDPTLTARYDETGLRNLLRDTEVHVDRLALCVAGDDSHWLKQFADQAATVFRRRGVAMDDVVRLCEGLRSAARGVLSDEEMVPANAALDEAVATYRWYRRLSGDARKKNRIVDAIYKGI
jgi:hypothetical protein